MRHELACNSASDDPLARHEHVREAIEQDEHAADERKVTGHPFDRRRVEDVPEAPGPAVVAHEHLDEIHELGRLGALDLEAD